MIGIHLDRFRPSTHEHEARLMPIHYRTGRMTPPIKVLSLAALLMMTLRGVYVGAVIRR
jgi:hypothetical protein